MIVGRSTVRRKVAPAMAGVKSMTAAEVVE